MKDNLYPKLSIGHPSDCPRAGLCFPAMRNSVKTHLWQRNLFLGFLGFLCACGGLSCARSNSERNPVVGVITPEYFRFRDVVPDDDPDASSGGWRAVCIHAQINHGDSGAKTVCKFEVGVPLRTQSEGAIPLEEAQFAAASMANRAARSVLSDAHPGEMFAVLCKRFKDVYQPILRAKIQGALVSDCNTQGIEVVLFGITADSEPTP